ncbi:hypothetical protein VM1G_02255 [Cytospora mali]|uniref:Uncharacterized protein n=1 Tax=Cytospora mali TaxID=578113 RepID=A0A194VPN7_CYTMA|nr:hypothetical protein VM1G_02255 [Valsa mali]
MNNSPPRGRPTGKSSTGGNRKPGQAKPRSQSSKGSTESLEKSNQEWMLIGFRTMSKTEVKNLKELETGLPYNEVFHKDQGSLGDGKSLSGEIGVWNAGRDEEPWFAFVLAPQNQMKEIPKVWIPERLYRNEISIMEYIENEKVTSEPKRALRFGTIQTHTGIFTELLIPRDVAEDPSGFGTGSKFPLQLFAEAYRTEKEAKEALHAYGIEEEQVDYRRNSRDVPELYCGHELQHYIIAEFDWKPLGDSSSTLQQEVDFSSDFQVTVDIQLTLKKGIPSGVTWLPVQPNEAVLTEAAFKSKTYRV